MRHLCRAMKGIGAIFLMVVVPFIGYATAMTGLSVEESEALSRDLGKAIQLYHEKDFDGALPLFRKIAEQVENADILFWLGTSAARTGNCQLAIDNLEKILTTKPNQPRVQVELAIAYTDCGRYNDAKRMIDKVNASNPPAEVRPLIENLSRRIEQEQKRFRWNIRFSQGYQYDSNVSCGPDDDTLGLQDKYTENEGHIWLTDLMTGFYYDFGQPGGFLWNGGLDFLYNYADDTDFNYLNLDITTGIQWIGKRDIVKLPIGFVHKSYGDESLSNAFYLNPGIEHYFSDRLSLKGDYRFTIEDYTQDQLEDQGYDNLDHQFSIGPVFYLAKRRHIITTQLGVRVHDADESYPSFDSFFGSLSYSTVFPTNTDLVLYYKIASRSYDDPMPGFNEDRDDTRNTLAAMVTQTFLKHYFVSLEISYINNSSNIDVYDFDKTTFALNVGLNF